MGKPGIIGLLALAGMVFPRFLMAQESRLSDRVIQIQAESTTPPSSALDSAPDSVATTPDSTSQQAMSQPASPFASNSQPFSSGLVRPSSRMYDAPNMFGDFFTSPGRVSFLSSQQFFFLDSTAQATLDPTQLALLQQQLNQSANQQAAQQFNGLVTFDPVQLTAVQNQLSTDATQQARQQIIDQQNAQSMVDADQVNIILTLPDLTNTVVLNPTGFNINLAVGNLNNAIVNPVAQPVLLNLQGSVDMQLAGGTRQTKIIENNHTLPQDRVYLLFNHFHNALTTDEFLLPSEDATGVTTSLDVIAQRRVQSVNRFTLGFEKTFEDGQSSLEFRLPLIGELEGNPLLDVYSRGGTVGNFSVIAKRLFYTTDNFAVSAGLGLNLPTGSDANGAVVDVDWRVKNEAVHYLPFVGVAGTPADEFFYQAFAQLDIAGTGNPVDVSDPDENTRAGRLNDQTLLFLDATAGAWLYTNPDSRIAGLASILELHYTTSLQDADSLGVLSTTDTGTSVLVFGNPFNQLDILNGTVGLHTLLQNGTTIRVGGVFPLQNGEDNQLFDSEVQASVNIPF